MKWFIKVVVQVKAAHPHGPMCIARFMHMCLENVRLCEHNCAAPASEYWEFKLQKNPAFNVAKYVLEVVKR